MLMFAEFRGGAGSASLNTPLVRAITHFLKISDPFVSLELVKRQFSVTSSLVSRLLTTDKLFLKGIGAESHANHF